MFIELLNATKNDLYQNDYDKTAEGIINSIATGTYTFQ